MELSVLIPMVTQSPLVTKVTFTLGAIQQGSLTPQCRRCIKYGINVYTRSDVAVTKLVSLATKLVIFQRYRWAGTIKWVQKWGVISGGAWLSQWLAIICEATHPRFRRTHLWMRLESAAWWTVANHCGHYLNMICRDIAPQGSPFSTARWPRASKTTSRASGFEQIFPLYFI